MKSLEEIVEKAVDAEVRIRVNADALSRASVASPTELFHAPLLALTIMVVARGRESGLATADMATWTLGTLTRHFAALTLARGPIHWSIALRRRCAEALVFLENVGLVDVRETLSRTIHLSQKGREALRDALRRADEVGVLARQLERAHRAVQQKGLELL